MGKTSRQGIRSQKRTVFELQLLDKNIQHALVEDIGSEARFNYNASISNVERIVHMPLTVAQFEEGESGCSPCTYVASGSSFQKLLYELSTAISERSS